MKLRLLFAVITVNLVVTFAVSAQTSGTPRIFRGAVGDSHIQMSLTFNGNKVEGTYAYDSVGQDIKLTGTLGAGGSLELTEYAEKGKPSGKFLCKGGLDNPLDKECGWTRPDGSRQSFVRLEEQSITLTNGLQIVPKLITNRRKGITVSYPQLASSGSLSAGAQGFNRRMLALTQKAITEDFGPIDEKGVFDANYNVLLGTNDLVSVEMVEYIDGGGAHPNERWWALTFDLAANKQLKLEDLFLPGSDYSAAIARYVSADINRRDVELEKDNAKRDNREYKPREEPLMSEDQLAEISDWALTPKGVVIYFDFPHVMAYFDKNFVPFSAIKEHLKPNGPATRLQK